MRSMSTLPSVPLRSRAGCPEERIGKIDATRKPAGFAKCFLVFSAVGLPFGVRNVDFVMHTAAQPAQSSPRR